MSMSNTELLHITRELERRYGDLEVAFPEGSYSKCYEVYNNLNGNSLDWTYVEFRIDNIDLQQPTHSPKTYDVMWVWRRKF